MVKKRENGRRLGRLVVFEGVDRSGKTTQIEMCEDWLAERCRLIRFPYRENSTGKFISSILSKQEANPENPRLMHLLFSANRWEEKHKIEEWLSLGLIVLVDRYVYSGYAYTQAQDPSILEEWLRAPDTGLPSADCVIMLDADPEELACNRGDYGKELYEEIEFQRKVRKAYQSMAENNPKWNVINVGGDKSAEQVHRIVRGILCELL